MGQPVSMRARVRASAASLCRGESGSLVRCHRHEACGLNGEVKRRADVVGMVPNSVAVICLVGALMLEQNDEWTVNRRSMSLESLAPLSDNPQIRLPSVAA